MKKIAGLVIIITCLLPLSEISILTVKAEAELPKWSVGDKWVYETYYYGLTLETKTEIINITTINVNDTNYEVYVAHSTSSAPWTASISDKYVLTENMATVKTVTIWGYAENKTETMTTYQPPKKDFDFPLSVGKNWTTTYTYFQNSESLGNFTKTEIKYYNVTGIETITVKAGTFECYVIEDTDKYGVVYTKTWYSPKVKNSVRTEETYRITITTDLASYSIKRGGDEDDFDLLVIPYVMLLIIIPIILVIVVNSLIGRRKGKQKKM